MSNMRGLHRAAGGSSCAHGHRTVAVMVPARARCRGILARSVPACPLGKLSHSHEARVFSSGT
eukprot:5776398-Ditylum_brightwellii.AAC.1